jgi:hypothetical protein
MKSSKFKTQSSREAQDANAKNSVMPLELRFDAFKPGVSLEL